MKDLYDVIIIGSGPAGLSAAIYAARAKFRVLVLEKEKMGSQITITSEIVNYPGVEKTDGTTLTNQMWNQAKSFGASFLMAKATGLEVQGEKKIVKTDKGDFTALSVVLALGANPRMLGFPGEKEYKGRGVAYCATCDGEFFTGMEVFVIGGGFAAAEEAVFLTRYASKVTIIVREEDFTCAAAVAEEAKNHEKIEVHYNTELLEAKGDGLLRSARFRNNATGEEWLYDAPEGKSFGIFVFAGYVPDTEWVKGVVSLDDRGYILTNASQQTSLPGVYGAGDVCIKNLRQVVTAVSDGATAATSLELYVSDVRRKLGLKDREPEIKTEKELQNHSEIKSADKAEIKNQNKTNEPDGFLTGEMKSQLKDLFGKFQNRITVEALIDESSLAKEMEGFVSELSGISGQVVTSVKRVSQKTEADEELPVLQVLREDGSESGIRFYGIPGGHEFNSFIIGLYNAAGPGQALEPQQADRIHKLKNPAVIKTAVSLSCTMCPATVMAAGRIAVENPLIEAHTYDLSHYPELKEKHQIMSVPCLIINDKVVDFGKKSVDELLDLLEKTDG